MANMYFIAHVAPKEINEDVLKWKQLMQERFDCSVALRSPAHITLIPPFWMDEVLENKVQNTISNFSQQQTPFELNLKDFAAFKPKVIYVGVLPNQSLQTLHFRLQEFLTQGNLFPIKPEDRPFHPHVTIATRDLHKKSFYGAWEIFKEKEYEASWLVNSISLLRHNQKNWDVIFTSQFTDV
jgi:2'-5' RNA ligase